MLTGEVNPHLVMEIYSQSPRKLNNCVCIPGSHIVGPSYIEGNLNEDTHLNLLQKL